MNPVTRTWRVYRKQGARGMMGKIVTRAFRLELPAPTLVRRADVLTADWRRVHHSIVSPREIPGGPLKVAWIMSPPGANSGGHQNIFRFMSYLEQAGHSTCIYLDSAVAGDTVAEVRRRVTASSSYAQLTATIEEYPRGGVPADVDVIVATGWETAYRSWSDPSDARRLYFVQDFEPAFYPASTEGVLAENTYRFDFAGITAGRWLAQQLGDGYGMRAGSFDFAADTEVYRRSESGRRHAVFFYARPETPRRGFELGEMALEIVMRDRPDTKVIFGGQDLRGRHIPFRHHSVGNLQVGELNAVYNQCAAGLVLSLTNMSLLPLELLAAGVIPVVNDAPSNRLVSDNPHIAYTDPNPRAIADAIIEILDRADQTERSKVASQSVPGGGWAASGRQFLLAFDKAVRG